LLLLLTITTITRKGKVKRKVFLEP